MDFVLHNGSTSNGVPSTKDPVADECSKLLEQMLQVALLLAARLMRCALVIRLLTRVQFVAYQHVVKEEFNRSHPVMHLLLRYTQALITQMAQTAVCNRHHTVDQQLCRWLLLTLDRMPGAELVMTQELIANMLGVRREGVTEAAGELQKAGLIKYSRGRINVLNRAGLEHRVCECYAVVKKEFDRLLPYQLHGLPVYQAQC